jgi:ketosteroid isomerase-like protein
MTDVEARKFADKWIAAWNSHDLEAILFHYSEDVTLTSPVAAKLLNRPDGKVAGKQALRDYFTRGLAAFPNLKFELLDVLGGMSSVVLYYINHKRTKTAEFMEFNGKGLVTRVVANYSSES